MTVILRVCLLVTLICLVSCCEKETHYTNSQGKCCKMCGPGTRMMKDDNCDDPRCKECEAGEYQSGYTKETICERQPSCDTNLNFLPQMNSNKTSRNECQCKPGYYCDLDHGCEVCRKHTVCEPGQRVAVKGSPIRDNVCEECSDGTFSTNHSADTCKEWTKCEYGEVDTPGSSTSDQTCVGTRDRTAVIVVCVLLILIAAAALVGCLFFKKGKSHLFKLQKQTFMEIRPDDDVTIAVQQQPEEEDENAPVSPTLSNMTENGNFVVQEHGKDAIIPCHESTSNAYQ
uniref:tumor necrosis factor receptor superfamily member 5 precursor n=1 Tax=Danio rerio TaxID=7955 RepID=UPI003D80C707